jgi:hypothetical protein
VKSRSSSYSEKLKVTFQKLDHRDNPKVNALIIWKGSIERMYRLDKNRFLFYFIN